ncbi:16S rRNA (guanine(966)-N(2))-methyltransferase RsmD [Balneola sp. MJW-20]|uniref:16S rRNA (guanine(966)-N(2))-methyltransferase RsmD n=1 Tax=Gracilimonas aurantiaca TaxID=3234185 RepID=UPI003465DD00
MRIITGKLKGRRFNIPKGLDVRPTTDRAKESIFNLIEARKYIDGSMILDLFAGSGNLGIEAISRAAKFVTFVERDPANAKLIEKLLRDFDVEDQGRVVTADVQHFLKQPAIPQDFIFCDPPYDYPLVEELVEEILASDWLKQEGWFILEHDKYHDFREHPKCIFEKPYGRTIISIFVHDPDEHDR